MDPAPDADGRYGAALLFLRWNTDAARPEGHLETEYLAHGHDPDTALEPILALSLHAVKAHLERLIGERAAGGRAP